ncbi:MAG: lasso peptide biosynthesis B2 protein [Anaerolineae bacterium]|jgi:hypothetical protein|nr:lasso peptide biosynthesis B2 protein [Anaerolineae bacterium]
MSLLRRFQRQPVARRTLLIEAAMYLLLARLALHVLPFRRIAAWLNRPPRRTELAGEGRERIRKEVIWAIEQAAKQLPGETVCFPRALAAQAMLRRRGISTTLYYGAATLPERGLTAHVWVQDGDEGVVGHREAGSYHVLARYPEPRG